MNDHQNLVHLLNCIGAVSLLHIVLAILFFFVEAGTMTRRRSWQGATPLCLGVLVGPALTLIGSRIIIALLVGDIVLCK